MKMQSIGPIPSTRIFRDQLARVIQEFDGDAKLVVLFPSISTGRENLLAEVLAVTGDTPVVGATTGGAGFTERGFTREGIVGAVLGGRDVDINISVARDLQRSQGRGLTEAIKRLQTDTSAARQAVMVLADPYACDGELITEMLKAHTPVFSSHFGGTAGDGFTTTGAFLLAEREFMQDCAVFVSFSGVHMRVSARHGWAPVPGAAYLTVTEGEGGVIHRLNGRPAQEVYAEELRRAGVEVLDSGVTPSQMASYPFGVDTPLGEKLKIRAGLRLLDGGGILLGSAIPESGRVRVVMSNPEKLIEAATNLTEQMTARAGGEQPEGSLVFDCAGRLAYLGERYGEQVEAFCTGGPLLGMAAYGEVAQQIGALEGFHNSTASMTMWGV